MKHNIRAQKDFRKKISRHSLKPVMWTFFSAFGFNKSGFFFNRNNITFFRGGKVLKEIVLLCRWGILGTQNGQNSNAEEIVDQKVTIYF